MCVVKGVSTCNPVPFSSQCVHVHACDGQGCERMQPYVACIELFFQFQIETVQGIFRPFVQQIAPTSSYTLMIADPVMAQVQFSGLTPLGSKLDEKVRYLPAVAPRNCSVQTFICRLINEAIIVVGRSTDCSIREPQSDALMH